MMEISQAYLYLAIYCLLGPGRQPYELMVLTKGSLGNLCDIRVSNMRLPGLNPALLPARRVTGNTDKDDNSKAHCFLPPTQSHRRSCAPLCDSKGQSTPSRLHALPHSAAHLQLPDVLALLCDLVDRLAHEGNEHVEQEDVGEDDVGQ